MGGTDGRTQYITSGRRRRRRRRRRRVKCLAIIQSTATTARVYH
jgi:hypothetical protein